MEPFNIIISYLAFATCSDLRVMLFSISDMDKLEKIKFSLQGSHCSVAPTTCLAVIQDVIPLNYDRTED